MPSNLTERAFIPHKASRNYSAKDFSIPSMIIAHIKIHVWNEKNRIWRWTVLPTTLLALSFYNMNINISHTCLWINQVDFLLTSQKEQEKQNPRCSKEEYLVWNLINVKKFVWFWNHWLIVASTYYSWIDAGAWSLSYWSCYEPIGCALIKQGTERGSTACSHHSRPGFSIGSPLQQEDATTQCASCISRDPSALQWARP